MGTFRKTFFACMALLFCFGSEIQAQKKLCLREIISQYEGDEYFYSYNKDALLDSSFSYVSYYDESIYHLYTYDDRGNITCESGYCVLPSDPYDVFTKTYDVKYEFDEYNRKISRKNYNLDTWGGTGKFMLGGMYIYEYDENNLLKKRTLYWDENKTDLAELTDFTYDANGLLVKETYTRYSWEGDGIVDMYIDYTYDEKGRILGSKEFNLNSNTGDMEEVSNRLYTYDQNDNLTSRMSYATDPNFPIEEHRLVYFTDTLASETAYPMNYEDDMDFYRLSKNVIKEDSLYRRDVEGLTYDLYDISKYSYANLDSDTGIESVHSDIIAGVRRDVDGNIMIDGLDYTERVCVFDTCGKLIQKAMYNGKVNVSNLPEGVYVIKTRSNCFKFKK